MLPWEYEANDAIANAAKTLVDMVANKAALKMKDYDQSYRSCMTHEIQQLQARVALLETLLPTPKTQKVRRKVKKHRK